MSIEAVRDKFRWGGEAKQALREAEATIATLFSMESGFCRPPADLDLRLEAKHGAELAAVVAEACGALTSCYHNTRHPRSLAHMVPPPATASVLGDLLKGASNQCAFTWRQGPLVPAMETAVLKWLASILGFGAGSGGLFTSGGTISNYIAAFLALARAREYAGQRERLCLIASDQAHFSIHKAAQLIGIGSDGLFLAPSGPDGRLQPDALASTVDRAVSRGCRPFLFVCTAGTTNAGVLEPIEAFASAAHSFSAWLHLDGAHGAFSALSSDARRQKDYWNVADSVSWDPHKTLFVSYPAGALIMRNRENLALLECRADYAFHESAPIDPAFCHLEGSRGFDALKVWLTIRHIGRDGFTTLTDYLLELARYLVTRVRETDSFELVTSADTNIVCFRYVNAMVDAARLDALNIGIQEELYLKGDALLSRTIIGGRAVLRAVLQNPFTTKEDIDQLVLEVVRAAERAGQRRTPGRDIAHARSQMEYSHESHPLHQPAP
jgi:L-2,4-diaminobutyrate decarboxylase